MATPEEIKAAKELEAIERSRRDIAREMQGITASQAYTRDSVAQAASLTDYARMLTEEMKEQAGIRRGQSEVDKSLVSLSRELQTSAQRVTSELGNEYAVQKQIAKDRELQRKIEIEIANQENALSAARIATAEKVSSIQQSIADADRQSLQLKAQIESRQDRIQELQEKGLSSSNSQVKNLEKEIELLSERQGKFDSIVSSKTEDLDIAKQGITDEELKLSTLNSQLGVITDIQGIRLAELELQKQITKATGVTGAVVGGIGGIMQRLGMRSGIFNQAMEDAKTSMEDFAGEAIKAGKPVSKIRVALIGLDKIVDGFSQALFDPLTIALAIADAFIDVNKAATEFTQLTGMPSDQMAGVNTRISTTVDLLKQSASLTRELGFNAAVIFTPDQVGQISDIKTLLGLGEAAAGRLGLMMKSTGQPAEAIRDSISNTVSELNESGKSAIAPRQVLDDVLTTSEEISASLGNNPKALAAAATAARQFGMNLAQVDRIAGSLMEFESSIEAELEAQLLTGKNINMSKARELALNNDLEGVAKELANQGASAAEFASMNRIQQEALAKSLGMSRQELAKSVLTQEAMANMSKEQIAAARGVSLAESERIDIQERIQKSMQSLAQAFAPILEAVVPVVETLSLIVQPIAAGIGMVAKLIASFLKLTPVVTTLKTLIAGAFAFKFASYIKGVMLAGKSLQSLVLVQKSYNLVQKRGLDYSKNMTGAYSTAVKRAKEYKNMTIGQTIAVKAHNAAVFVADKIKKAYAATTTFLSKQIAAASKVIKTNTVVEKLNGFATDIGTSIKKKAIAIQKAFTSTRIGGRIATVASTVAEKAKTAAEKVSLFLGKTRIGQMIAERAAIVAKTAATYLGIGATQTANAAAATAATTGAAGGAGMASFAAGLVALTPAIPVILSIGAALLLASPAIYAFGLAVKSTFEGVASIVTAFAPVMIGIAEAIVSSLSYIPPIVQAIGTGISTVINGIANVIRSVFNGIGTVITSISSGLATMLDAISLDKAVAVGALGLSLVGLAAGVSALALTLPALLIASAGIALLGASAQSLASSDFTNITQQLIQLGSAGPGLIAAAAGLFAIAGGLTAFSLAMAATSAIGGISNIFGSNAITQLESLIAMASPLSQVGVSLTAISAGLAGIATALSSLETEKLEELKDLVITTAFAAPMVAATGAITDLISGLGGGAGEGESNQALLEEIRLLRAAVEQDRVTKVYMDSNELDMRIVQGRSGQ